MNIKLVIGIVFYFILLFGPPILAVYELFPGQNFKNPVVLLVGDFSPYSFGANVKSGVESAKSFAVKEVPSLEVIDVEINDPSNEVNKFDPIKFKTTIARLIATKNVVGIISANSSESAKELIPVAEAFQIPLLLTVATNKKLIDSESEFVIRLLPNDESQVEVIAEWLLKHETSIGATAVVYDVKAYGRDLQRALRKAVGTLGFIPYKIKEGTDSSGIVMYGLQNNCNKWIILGYREQAIEIISKMKERVGECDVLLSDGCWGQWLGDLSNFPGTVSIAFPLPISHSDFVEPQINKKYQAYAPYGRDALILLSAAINRTQQGLKSRTEILSYLKNTVLINDLREELSLEYSFKDSENIAAKFSIHSIKSNKK